MDSVSLIVVIGSKARIETRIKSAKSSKLGPFKNTRIVPTLVCPSPKFVQNISKVKNFLSANALLDNVWTKIEFPGVKSVQWPQVWTGSLLTLDRDGTDLVLCMSLDRHLTEFWQSLDKDWIFCPISVQPPYVKEHRKINQVSMSHWIAPSQLEDDHARVVAGGEQVQRRVSRDDPEPVVLAPAWRKGEIQPCSIAYQRIL